VGFSRPINQTEEIVLSIGLEKPIVLTSIIFNHLKQQNVRFIVVVIDAY
jgi:hypothetical protein